MRLFKSGTPAWRAPMLALLAGFAAPAMAADIVAVAVDRTVRLVDGAAETVPDAPPDSIVLIDTSAMPPAIVGAIDAPASVAGPPGSIAVSPDGTLVLVTAGRAARPDGRLVPDNRLTAIDIGGAEPAVTARTEAGAGAAGVAFTPDGRTALVANRDAGTVSVFAIDSGIPAHVRTVAVGDAASGPSGIAVTPDGHLALVTLDGAHGVAVLDIDGRSASLRPRLLTGGMRPYDIAISPDGRLAAIGNMGRSQGDEDTVSLADLSADPIRVVATRSVGMMPEGVAFSPDGRFLAVALQNGSQMPAASPFHAGHGLLRIFAIGGTAMTPVAEAPIGRWSQGVAFTHDGRHVIAQSMADERLDVFAFSGTVLHPLSAISLGGGGAAMAR